jgi:hypothetical protein
VLSIAFSLLVALVFFATDSHAETMQRTVKSCFCWKIGGGKRGFGWVMAALCAWQNRFSFADEVQQSA